MPYTKRPREHDTKCPDGFTCYGWRIVRKGGYVRFSKARHYHEELLQFVGMWVYVMLDDPWGCNVAIYPEGCLAGVLPWLSCNELEWNEARAGNGGGA